MTIKTNILSLEYSDDMKTLADKLNYNFRNICREANISIETNPGEGASRHNELAGREDADCHPDTAITGLASFISETSSKLLAIEENVRTILNEINRIDEKLTDHEARIRALERK